jgi:hypothetical protein
VPLGMGEATVLKVKLFLVSMAIYP